MFEGKRRLMVIGGVVLALAAVGGGGAVVANSLDDSEQPITGEALQKASKAALDYTGEGHVSETEVGDEDSYYEVEVTLDDGSQVDVQLDENFNVVSHKVDDDTTEDQDGAD